MRGGTHLLKMSPHAPDVVVPFPAPSAPLPPSPSSPPSQPPSVSLSVHDEQELRSSNTFLDFDLLDSCLTRWSIHPFASHFASCIELFQLGGK